MATSLYEKWLRILFLHGILWCTLVYSFGLHEQIWFEIVEPRNVSYLFKIRPAKNFGNLIESPLLHTRMVIADPDHACSKLLINGEMLHRNVVLIKRGGCSFITKAINVELYGAVAAIISDNKEDEHTASIDMIGDGTDRNNLVGIPAFFLMGKDGFMIRRAMEMSGQPFAIINLPVNITNGVPLNQPPWDYW